MVKGATLLGGMLLALTGPAGAQQSGTIIGIVRDAGTAAPGARVGIRGTLAFSVMTDSAGRFILREVPPGDYVVVAALEGSNFGTAPAVVRGGDTVMVAIALGGPVEIRGITVTASRRPSYITDSATGATKYPAPLMDIPQQVTVVPQSLIDDRHITESRELTRNVAGVVATPPYTGTELNETNFIFRGQPSSSGLTTLRDGFRDFGALMPLDMASVDRVEFLMGPESVLYGSAGSVGGMANFVSKQPLAQRAGALTLSADQRGGVRSTLDLGGPLSASGQVRYRFNAAGEQIRSYRDYSAGSYGFSIAPAVAWLPSERTSVTFTGNYTQRSYPGDPFLPIYSGTFRLPVSRFYGEPLGPLSLAQGLVGQLVLSYRLSNSVLLRERLAYSSARLSDYNYELEGLDSLGTSVTRDYGHSDETAHDGASQTELIATFMTGSMRNRAIAGLELSAQRHPGSSTGGDWLAPISLDHPVYGAVPTDTAGVERWQGSVNQLGLYAQDLLDVGPRVKLMAGARLDINRSAFTFHNPTDTFELQQTVDHVSPRLGLVYQPAPATSLYGSWANSFWPNQSCARCGDPTSFPPEVGQQFEVGVKRQFADGKFGATLALYQLTKNNIMIGDPSDPTGMSVLVVGSMQSRGVELSATGSPAPGLGVILAYAYTDSRVNEGNETFPVGTVPANVPRNRLSLWSSYTMHRGALRGFAFGAGLTKADWQYANWGDPYRLPGYTLLDAMLGYHGAAFGAQVNLTNLTNARSYQGVRSTEVAPGAPRAVVLTMSYLLMNP
jgi:iron complex outermembrane receptor protein